MEESNVERACATAVHLLSDRRADSLRVLVIQIESELEPLFAVSDLSVPPELSVLITSTMQQWANRGVPVVCSILGHITGHLLHLCASAHYRIIDTRATFACADGDLATIAEVNRVLHAKDAPRMVGEGTVDAPHVLMIGFAHEVCLQKAEERALSFACWIALQPPIGLRHMLQLLCSSGQWGIDSPQDSQSLKTDHGRRLREQLGYRELTPRAHPGCVPQRASSGFSVSPSLAAEEVRRRLQDGLLRNVLHVSQPKDAGALQH